MNQLDELVAILRANSSHRESLAMASSQEELLAIFMDIAETEGLYVEEAVIEAAILASARMDFDDL